MFHTWFFKFVVSSFLIILVLGFLWPVFFWLLLLLLPVICLGIYDFIQDKHTIRRNFPFFGRTRWIMEMLRPYLRQYFLESETDGSPISRMFRSIIYQRAKDTMDTVPYGTKVDTYRTGYEWIGHSLSAVNIDEIEKDIRITVGGPQCRQPYHASIFNISAMSFGSLSPNAILALNRGAKIGGFYHNTGEGGLSEYHLRNGGDVVWQVGTGYFGCRTPDGKFCPDKFAELATQPSVRMIELKLSQGAKPGHGGILPASKNSPEIARIRGVPPNTRVVSPSVHSAFDTPIGLLQFINQLRELAGGKPVGMKLSIGRKSEFIAICKAMIESGIYPDFITVDGGEGGTGAAPLEYTNSIGMPLREALAFVADCLRGFGLRQHIRIIASGKIFTGFHLIKNLSLGADICNSARGMMLALGCVHSLVCNTNRCPSGVATQDPKLYRGLVVTDKADRVAQYHAKTVYSTAEILASAGLKHTNELDRSHIYRRISQSEIRRYDEIFPYIEDHCLIEGKVPEAYSLFMDEATANSFKPNHSINFPPHQ